MLTLSSNKAVPLSNPPTNCDCEGHVQVGRRYLQETATIITPATRDETDSRWLSQNPSQSSDATTETDLTDTDSIRLRRNKKRGPDNSLVSTISKKSCPDMKPGSEYRFNPATVITKLLRSLEDMKKAANRNNHLTRMRAGDDEWHHAADKIAQSLGEKLPALSGWAYIFHPPAVITALWNEDYETLCKQLGADNLALENPAVVKLQYSVEPELYTYAVRLEHRCPLQHGGPDGGKIDFGNLAHGKLFSPHTHQHIGCNTSIAGRQTQQGFDGINGTVSVSGEPRAEGSSGRSSCRSSSNGCPSAISPVAGSQEIDDALGIFRHVGNDTPATHATERNATDNFADIEGSGITAVDVGIFDKINGLERNATDNFPDIEGSGITVFDVNIFDEIDGLERNVTDNFPDMEGLGNTAFDGGIFEASHQFS
ncbi:hypothetical protein MHUMG1_01716 [Metarhizium humberi]|uniref:Uncharacterized protein n=1 Tax=Metarhizium humberi TaxID=2596975 RepID=A0A9P8MJ24_9HYPO|nr:hypothetical protein MHUMG1_01716 [Metarhizium humberi]